MKELCKDLDKYLAALFQVDCVFNVYKLRQFLEFNKAELYPEHARKSINPNSETYFAASPAPGEITPEVARAGRVSFMSDYFNENVNSE